MSTRTLDRRTFLTRSAAAGGTLLSLTALERLALRDAQAGRPHRRHDSYGPLERVADQRGVEVLALPAGFSYVTFSHTGSTMSDGNPTPLALDGMAAFDGGRRGLVRLVRNSEDRNAAGAGASAATRGQVRRRRRRRHHHAGLRRAQSPARGGLREPQRHDRQLRGRHRLPGAAG